MAVENRKKPNDVAAQKAKDQQPKKKKRSPVKPSPALEKTVNAISIFVSVLALGLHLAGIEHASPYVTLSHPDDPEHKFYNKGENDVLFVAYWIFAFTAIRWLTQIVVLHPLAYIMGCPKKQLRKFYENGWCFLFFVVAWCTGAYLAFIHEDAFVTWNGFWEETVGLWRGYPHKMTHLMKLYYLLQTAFWFHYMGIQFLSTRRGDHLLMVAHHIVTISLLVGSYYCGFFRSGCLVLVNQDAADIFLPLAKMLKISGYALSDAVFAFFAVVWIPSRHWLFWCPIYALLMYADDEACSPYDGVTCFYHPVWTKVIFLTFLLALQALLLVWLKHLLVAVYKALKSAFTGGKAEVEDHLSESEDEDDEDEDDKGSKQD